MTDWYAERMPAPAKGASLTLRDLLTVVFYRRNLVLVAMAVPLVLGLLFALATRPAFVADARLLILLSSDYAARSQTSGEQVTNIAFDRDQIVKAEIEILGSRDLYEQVIQSIGPRTIYPGLVDGTSTQDHGVSRHAMSDMVDQFGRNLRIDTFQGSNVLRLEFRHPDASVASNALDALIQLYFERRRTVFSQERTSFLTSQRDSFGQRLKAVSDELTDFQRKNNVANLDQQLSLLLGKQSDLRAQQMQNEDRFRSGSAQVAALQKRLAALPSSVVVFSENTRLQSLDNLRLQLLQLQVRRADLITRFQDSSRQIQDLDQQIRSIQSLLAGEAPRLSDTQRLGRNVVFDDLQRDYLRLQAELDGLTAQRASLKQQGDDLSGQINDLLAKSSQLRELQLNRSLLEESFRSYTLRVEDARVAENADRGRSANVRIVQPPEVPSKPQSARGGILIGALLASVLVGAVAAVLANATRQVFLTPADAERALGLPVLAAPPLRGGTPAASSTFFSWWRRPDNKVSKTLAGSGLSSRLGLTR